MPYSDTQSGMIPSERDASAPVPVAGEGAKPDRELIERQIERITQLESLLSDLSESEGESSSEDVVDRLNQRIDELENVLRQLSSPEAWALAWAREREPWVRIRNVLETDSN